MKLKTLGQCASHGLTNLGAGRIQLLAELGGSSLVMGTDGPDQTQECVDPIGEIAGVMGKL